jgi:hypothetical protein
MNNILQQMAKRGGQEKESTKLNQPVKTESFFALCGRLIW